MTKLEHAAAVFHEQHVREAGAVVGNDVAGARTRSHLLFERQIFRVDLFKSETDQYRCDLVFVDDFSPACIPPADVKPLIFTVRVAVADNSTWRTPRIASSLKWPDGAVCDGMIKLAPSTTSSEPMKSTFVTPKTLSDDWTCSLV